MCVCDWGMRLRWSHIPHCWKYHALAQIIFKYTYFEKGAVLFAIKDHVYPSIKSIRSDNDVMFSHYINNLKKDNINQITVTNMHYPN